MESTCEGLSRLRTGTCMSVVVDPGRIKKLHKCNTESNRSFEM